MSWSVESGTADPAATRALAAALAGVCRPGDVLLLIGALGAGKTTFAQGFARALGIEGPVTSPTFTLVRQYPCQTPSGIRQLIHADVYRVDSLDEVVQLALPELVEDGAVALVEWGDVAEPALGASTLSVTLERVAPASAPENDHEPLEGAEVRRVTVCGRGPDWAARQGEVGAAMTDEGRVGAPSGQSAVQR